MNRPRYKKLYEIEKYQHTKTRHKLSKYQNIPNWIVKICNLLKKLKTTLDAATRRKYSP